MKKFESINAPKFSVMDVEKMKRIKGGYTMNTVTCYSNGHVGDDGSASSDGVVGAKLICQKQQNRE